MQTSPPEPGAPETNKPEERVVEASRGKEGSDVSAEDSQAVRDSGKRKAVGESEQGPPDDVLADKKAAATRKIKRRTR